MTNNPQTTNINNTQQLNVGSEMSQSPSGIVLNINQSQQNNLNTQQQNQSPPNPANNPPPQNLNNNNNPPDEKIKEEYLESMKMKLMILGKHFHYEENTKKREYKKPKNCGKCCQECGYCFLYCLGYFWICLYDLIVYLIPLTCRCFLETCYMFCFIFTSFYKTTLLADHNRYYQFQHPYRVSIKGAILKRGCNVCMSTFKICFLRWGCCFCVLYDHFRRLYISSRRDSYQKLYGNENVSVEYEKKQEDQIIQVNIRTETNVPIQSNSQTNRNN